MWNYLTDKFLTEYFLYESVLGGFVDGQAVFNLLSKIFLLSDEEKAFAGNLVKSENLSEIKTESDYLRYQRSKKYFVLNGIRTDICADEDIAITLKGTALGMAKKSDCAYASVQTKLKTEEKLTSGAASGNIAAMRIAGVALYEGLFFTCNKEEGLRYLRMAATWNDIPSLMYSLYYDKSYTRRYAGKLSFLLNNVSHSEVLPIIERKYGCYKYGENKEAKLLEKLFRLNVLNRETYSAPHAKALFSDVVSYKDKEKMLYSAGKDYLSLISDLPFKLGVAGLSSFDFTALNGIPLKNRSEHSRIISRLNNSDLRKSTVYRPVCISSDSKYLLQLYAEAIAACAAKANVEYIYVDELNLSHLDSSKNNVFIRICDEDRDNIYLMFFVGNINDIVAEQAKTFLRSDGRRQFHLNMPNIDIDLSSVLPVCFCDLQNEKQLRGICDVIRIAECSESEKPLLLQYMAERNAILYGIPEIEMQDGLKAKLLSLSTDDMAKELDEEVNSNRQKGKKLVLTEEHFTAENINAAGNRYGFGGYRNENDK